MKICTKCKIEKPLEQYSWLRKAEGTLQARCKECCKLISHEWVNVNKVQHLAACKRWQDNNKERRAARAKILYQLKKEEYQIRRRNNYIKNKDLIQFKKYGVTSEEQKRMFEMQQGLCAICKRPGEAFKKGLALDHDHITSKFRGYLCGPCNAGLGQFQDNTERLQSAIAYLNQSPK